MTRTSWLLAALTVAATPATAQDPAPAPSRSTGIPLEGDVAATDAVADPQAPMQGFLGTRYRSRWTTHDDDHDVWQVGGFDLGETAVGGWRVHLLGRWQADLDGERRTQGYAPFDELSDVRAGAVQGWVHEAWLDLAGIPGVELLRLGRQSLVDTPESRQIDGVSVESVACPHGQIRVGGYAGAPVRQYDRETGWFLGGAWLGLQPVRWAEARVDWMTADESGPTGERVRSDLYGGRLRLTAPDWGWIGVRHTRLGHRARDLRIDLAGTVPRLRTQLIAAYIEQLETLTQEAALGFDELAMAGFTLYPYRQFQSRATQPLGEHVAVSAGVDFRRVRHDHQVGTYNRDFTRVRAGASVSDWPAEGVHADFDWSWWDSTGHRFWSAGGSLGYRRARRYALSAGTEFQLFAIDLFTGDERQRVRSWYGEVRVWLADDLDGRVRYAFEDDDLDLYHRLEVRLTWRF